MKSACLQDIYLQLTLWQKEIVSMQLLLNEMIILKQMKSMRQSSSMWIKSGKTCDILSIIALWQF